TNCGWLAEQLTELGFDVDEAVTVGDDLVRIVEELRRLAERHTVLVCSGGLGPTTDDLTTEAAARALGVSLVRHEPSLEAIRQRVAAAGREMSPSNVKQAELPEGAAALPNPVGTAPGFAIVLGDCRCFFLPGVPHEMERLFADHVQPALAPLVER